MGLSISRLFNNIFDFEIPEFYETSEEIQIDLTQIEPYVSIDEGVLL